MKRRLMFVRKVHARCPMPGNGRELSTEGEYVPRSAYWMRRLRDGDCALADPPKKSKSTATAKSSSGRSDRKES